MERYINLFTDYGFKKIFGEQPNNYRDLKNSLDTAFDEGKEEGRQQRALEIAKEMLAEGDSVARVARLTGLPLAMVEELQQSLRQ